jgi:hypothetical protein
MCFKRHRERGRNAGRMLKLMLYWKSIIKLACADGVLLWSPPAILAVKAALLFHLYVEAKAF